MVSYLSRAKPGTHAIAITTRRAMATLDTLDAVCINVSLPLCKAITILLNSRELSCAAVTLMLLTETVIGKSNEFNTKISFWRPEQTKSVRRNTHPGLSFGNSTYVLAVHYQRNL